MYVSLFKLLNPRHGIKRGISCYRSFIENPTILDYLSMSNGKNEQNAKEKIPLQKTYLTSTVQLQVIGSGAAGVPNSVLLINNNYRYLINCGEGTQKLSSEYRLNLEKASHVFITYPSWKNVSGLIGVFLMIQQSGKKEIFLHGYSHFETAFPSLNKYVKLKHLKIKYKNPEHYEEYFDGVTTVKYVHIHPSHLMNNTDFAISKPDGEKIFDRGNIIKKKTEKNSADLTKNYELPKNNTHEENFVNFHHSCGSNAENCTDILPINKTSNKYVTSYIFQTMPTSGALLFEKCVEYGVPPGPLLGQLKMGNDITLGNGRVVKSADVKNPDLPGVVIIVADCPSENYLDSFLKEQAFHEYQSGGKIAEAVVHFSDSEIVKNFKYQEWINNFPKGTKHLFINEDNNLSGSVGIPRQQFKLNYLHPDIFPLLYDAKIPDFPRAENIVPDNGHVVVLNENNPSAPVYSDKIYYKCESNYFIYGETLCTLYMKPKSEYDYSKCLVLRKKEFLNEMFKNNLKEKIDECKNSLEKVELLLKSDTRIYPKIVFLGTGSSRPSKVRNASGILIFIDEERCILFDCGENVYNQLIIFYGKQKTSHILRKLHAVYISHLHLDHHLGLVTILKERKLAFDELSKSEKGQKITKEMHEEYNPVILLAPEQILKWLEAFTADYHEIMNLFDLLPNSLLIRNSKESSQEAEICKKKLNLSFLNTVPVHHCSNSFGISIVHQTGWKITYSGDTKPCEALVKLGMNSDILIHEATFEKAFVKEAKIKLHSTTNQAIEIGRSMNAKYIILTHFSQRYCYLPVLEKKLSKTNVGIAFDFMEVPYNKLPLLSKLLEPLQYIFSEYGEKYQLISQKSSLKRKIFESNTSDFQSAETETACKDLENISAEESPAKISRKIETQELVKLSAFDKG